MMARGRAGGLPAPRPSRQTIRHWPGHSPSAPPPLLSLLLLLLLLLSVAATPAILASPWGLLSWGPALAAWAVLLWRAGRCLPPHALLLPPPLRPVWGPTLEGQRPEPRGGGPWLPPSGCGSTLNGCATGHATGSYTYTPLARYGSHSFSSAGPYWGHRAPPLAGWLAGPPALGRC